MRKNLIEKIGFSQELKEILQGCKHITIPTSRAEIYEMIFGKEHTDCFDVTYRINGQQKKEAYASST